VLVPKPHLVFTRCTEEVCDHKGQISFPGGAREAKDPSLLFTALRERQEVGLDPAHVDVVGELDDHDTVTRYRVTPFVSFILLRRPARGIAKHGKRNLEDLGRARRAPSTTSTPDRASSGGPRRPGAHRVAASGGAR
jgi:8-oxo-dGTP pyrophosphatase MutT (NUDIX family)